MKISYHNRFDSEGTVYNQAISITRQQLKSLELAIHSEIKSGYPRKKDYVYTSGYEMFLKPLRGNNVVFMNHTTTRFVNLFLKLDLKERNTCLLIR
jgi:hypothetical protein